jgi:hypothetical protein
MLAEHAVERRPERRGAPRRGLKKVPALARLEPCAKRLQLADAARVLLQVHMHDEVARDGPAEILATDHGLVPIVERGGANSYDHLSGARHRIGLLHQPQG